MRNLTFFRNIAPIWMDVWAYDLAILDDGRNSIMYIKMKTKFQIFFISTLVWEIEWWNLAKCNWGWETYTTVEWMGWETFTSILDGVGNQMSLCFFEWYGFVYSWISKYITKYWFFINVTLLYVQQKLHKSFLDFQHYFRFLNPQIQCNSV